MKAISLWQPYAQALALGVKRYETRSWGTTFRGQVAIHAARTTHQFRFPDVIEALRVLAKECPMAQLSTIQDLPLGAVVGVVQIMDCFRIGAVLPPDVTEVEKALGDWRQGRFAWKVQSLLVCHPPIPYKGKQGMWEWPMARGVVKKPPAEQPAAPVVNVLLEHGEIITDDPLNPERLHDTV